MFRIFSRFNALFVRPHIRGAIREYQTQLIQRVKDDIEALHDKFKVQDSTSEFIRIDQLFIYGYLASLVYLSWKAAMLSCMYIHCTLSYAKILTVQFLSSLEYWFSSMMWYYNDCESQQCTLFFHCLRYWSLSSIYVDPWFKSFLYICYISRSSIHTAKLARWVKFEICLLCLAPSFGQDRSVLVSVHESKLSKCRCWVVHILCGY